MLICCNAHLVNHSLFNIHVLLFLKYLKYYCQKTGCTRRISTVHIKTLTARKYSNTWIKSTPFADICGSLCTDPYTDAQTPPNTHIPTAKSYFKVRFTLRFGCHAQMITKTLTISVKREKQKQPGSHNIMYIFTQLFR